MDSVIEQLLTQLSVHMQQELDFPIDTQRFVSDAEFAAQVLALAEEIRLSEPRSLVTQIRNRQLQLLALHGGQQSATKPLPALTKDQQGQDAQRKPA